MPSFHRPIHTDPSQSLPSRTAHRRLVLVDAETLVSGSDRSTHDVVGRGGSVGAVSAMAARSVTYRLPTPGGVEAAALAEVA